MRDVSAGGLAVQTALDAGEGDGLCVRVESPKGAPVEVNAFVWHAHRVRSRRTGESGFLLGLVVSNPPEAWFDRIGAPRPAPEARPAEPERPAPPRCCDEAQESFVVRLKQATSPRTRTYRVSASSLDEARTAAEAEAHEGWHVIEVHAA